MEMNMIILIWCSFALLSIVSSEEASDAKPSVTEDTSFYFQLLNRVEILEQHDREQQTGINKLRTELQTEKRRTSRLERQLFELTSREEEGSASSEEANDVVGQTIYPDINVDKAANDSVGDTSSAKKAAKLGSRIRRQEGLSVVAFYATLTNHLHYMDVHQMITFDNVITNIGDRYNPHFGSFLAHVPGVYVFHTTIMGYSHHELHVSMVKNGTVMANLYIRGVESAGASDSALVIVHLNKGEDVFVQNNDLAKSINGNHYSMFSGFLLHEDHPTESIVGK